MSAASEIHLLRTRLAELEDSVKTIDRGVQRAEEKLRDKIAMHMPTDDLKIKDKELAEKIVGRPFNEDDYLETLRFAFDLVARLRYMMADAMLAARKEVKAPGAVGPATQAAREVI